MPTVDLIPPDPAHTPETGSPRALLYPLWVLELEIRPYPRAAPRSVRFSVDAMRGIPLPIRALPEIVSQEVPDRARILEGVSREQAEDVTRHFARKGLGVLGGFVARLRVASARRVYKLFWMKPESGELIDSRSGKHIPMDVPSDGAGDPPPAGDQAP